MDNTQTLEAKDDDTDQRGTETMADRSFRKKHTKIPNPTQKETNEVSR